MITLQQTEINAELNNSSNSAPSIEWQRNYDNFYNSTGVESVSNLIQTSDGGYAFMDLGWSFQDSFVPATVYKVDSLGNINWTKRINGFYGVAIKQTSDRGLEVSGYWINGLFFAGPEYATPTLIKMDSQGNIEWVRNYSSVPNLGVTPSSMGKIRTSDGGFVYWTGGSVVETASNNSTQWVKNLTYTGNDGTAPLAIASAIETSDGALAVLGVGENLFDNPRTGNIYLLMTEPFLPKPSPSNFLPLIISIVLSIVVVGIIVSVVFYRRHRKTANLKQ
jgi:hypothetical protein